MSYDTHVLPLVVFFFCCPVIYLNCSLFCVEYYAPGKTEKGTATVKRCSYTQLPQEGEVCDFEVRLWENCVPDKFFEYHRNSPCIFLKLNRIYGWVPEYYNTTRDLPPNMPKELKEHIGNVSEVERNTVWITCSGENPADIEYLGPMAYYPKIQGFPGYYFPYKNGEGYLSPLVAVQFLRPIGIYFSFFVLNEDFSCLFF